MELENTEVMAVRAEITSLLRQQLEALDSPDGLTDSKLIECYDRQSRVQELREKLQGLSAQELSERSEEGQPSNLLVMPSRPGNGDLRITG
jgi:hypothetical protein